MSNTSFGIFMALSSVANVVISTYIGKISDSRIDRKTILILATTSLIIGYLGYAFIRDYYILLFIAMFVLGIASSGTPQILAFARESINNSNVSPKETPLFLNIFRMTFSLSWTIGPAIAAIILVHTDFRGTFMIAAGGYFIMLVLIIFFIKSNKIAKTERKPQPRLVTHLKNPFISANVIAFILITAASNMNTVNMSYYVLKILNGSKEQIGIIFSIAPIFEIPFMLGMGILATKIDNKIIIRIGALISVLYFVLLSIVDSVWQIYLVQILSAAYISIIMGTAVSYFQDFIPNEAGTATTLFTSSTRIGALLGFLLFGVFSQYMGYKFVYLLCIVFTLVALIMLVIFNKNPNSEVQVTHQLTIDK
ncbi:sugar efflux transporter [Paenibacillus sp. GSMTC-2017]|nr:sugar efflux transporter [Paenibacillus sp. GSMTC-2017]